MVRRLVLAFALLGGGCLTLEDGDKLRAEIKDVRSQAARNETRAAELAQELDTQLQRLKQYVQQASDLVTRNSADVGGKVDKLIVDLAQLQGRIDDVQHAQDAVTKQFQDYRASSDTKLEQLTNTMTTAKSPPLPENADGVFSEGEKRLIAQQWTDARRLFEAFVNRYPADPRAAKAQYSIGEAYYGEKRFANAIGAYTKVIDNWPKAEIVQDAMFKNGLAFHSLKYCSDAKVYFQELIKRYPKTSYKGQANDQLKKLAKEAKDKHACAS